MNSKDQDYIRLGWLFCGDRFCLDGALYTFLENQDNVDALCRRHDPSTMHIPCNRGDGLYFIPRDTEVSFVAPPECIENE
jgi:hypothetical protein